MRSSLPTDARRCPATTRCSPTGRGRFSGYRPDVDALAAAPTRIVIAVGEESLDTFTGRTAVATAQLLGRQATVFPSHHGGFLGGEPDTPVDPRRSRADCARC